MRRANGIIMAILLAFAFPSRIQANTIPAVVDHDWTIHSGSTTFGLLQLTVFPAHVYENAHPDTSTIIYFGHGLMTIHGTVWHIIIPVILLVAMLSWLAIYGIGSLARSREKPPDPRPPP
jgi:hypothetical protein